MFYDFLIQKTGFPDALLDLFSLLVVKGIVQWLKHLCGLRIYYATTSLSDFMRDTTLGIAIYRESNFALP